MASVDPGTPDKSDRDAEAELGGADAIEKTTYVVGQGTDPDAHTAGRYTARDAAGPGGAAIWIIGAIAALIGLVYVVGIFR